MNRKFKNKLLLFSLVVFSVMASCKKGVSTDSAPDVALRNNSGVSGVPGGPGDPGGPDKPIPIVLLADYIYEGVRYTPLGDGSGGESGSLIDVVAFDVLTNAPVSTFGISGTYDQSSGQLYVYNMKIYHEPHGYFTYTGLLQ